MTLQGHSVRMRRSDLVYLDVVEPQKRRVIDV
jgi:hypothetical protein